MIIKSSNKRTIWHILHCRIAYRLTATGDQSLVEMVGEERVWQVSEKQL